MTSKSIRPFLAVKDIDTGIVHYLLADKEFIDHHEILLKDVDKYALRIFTSLFISVCRHSHPKDGWNILSSNTPATCPLCIHDLRFLELEEHERRLRK
jgi:hypothetical protein